MSLGSLEHCQQVVRNARDSVLFQVEHDLDRFAVRDEPRWRDDGLIGAQAVLEPE